MCVDPLPYDMGNAGDMIKHGLLAEYVEWWCISQRKRIKFLDPFGGRPWVEPPVTQVIKRVQSLGNCALSRVQTNSAQRYYGSGHVVRNAATVSGGEAAVLVSDANSDAAEDLVRSGLDRLSYPGFNAHNGFSILDTDIKADLILLDPFAGFLLHDAEKQIPKIAAYTERTQTPIILFTLNLNPHNFVGERFSRLRHSHFAGALSLHCPRMNRTGVRGEAGYESEVFLIIPKALARSCRVELEDRLEKFANQSSRVLGNVTFNNGRHT